MKTIAILSQKGGAGKSIVSVHLAVAAHQDDKAVVIADLDPQGSSHAWYQRRKHGGEPLPHVQKTNPASLSNLADAAHRQGADLLVLDTPPKSDKEAIAAAELADFVLLVASPSLFDLDAIQNTVRLTKLAKLKPGAQVALVLNKVKPFGTTDKEAVAWMRKLGVDVLPCGFGVRVAYEYGLGNGETALEYEPRGQAAEETRKLYQHLCKLVGMTASQHDVMTTKGKETYEQEKSYA